MFAFQELYRKIRSILNKLTPQKFQTLTQQIIDLDIDTADRLEGAIDLIFEKVSMLYRSKWDERGKHFHFGMVYATCEWPIFLCFRLLFMKFM